LNNSQNIFLEKQSIIRQIDNKLKNLLMRNPNRYDTTHNNKLVCVNVNCWVNYSKLKTMNINILRIKPGEISKPFIYLRKFTQNTQLRDFQFKLLHGIIPTRDKLLKYKYIPNNHCISCEEGGVLVRDDVTHSFISCPGATATWSNVKVSVKEILNIDINLSDVEIIEGFKTHSKIVNELAIQIKKLLHKPMTSRKIISIVSVNKIINDLQNIDKCLENMKINTKIK